jgi:hypothetical protein
MVRNLSFAYFELTNHNTRMCNMIHDFVIDWSIQRMRTKDFEPWFRGRRIVAYLQLFNRQDVRFGIPMVGSRDRDASSAIGCE